MVENREERKVAAFELAQHLALAISRGLTPQAILDDLKIRKPKGEVEKIEAELRPILDYAATLGDRLAVPAIPALLGGLDFSNRGDIVRRTNEYVEMTHRDTKVRKFFENSGKAGAINHTINGITEREVVSEMLRQILHHRLEERFEGVVYIPKDVVTKVDRRIVDFIPETVNSEFARPEIIAQALAREVAGGRATDEIIDTVNHGLQIDFDSFPKARDAFVEVIEEIRSRIVLRSIVEGLAARPQANVRGLVAANPLSSALSTHERRRLELIGGRVSANLRDGYFEASSDRTTITLSTNLRQSVAIPNPRKQDTRSYNAKSGLLEHIYLWSIQATPRTAVQMAETAIAIRKLPHQALKQKGDSAIVAPQLQKYAPRIDELLDRHSSDIRDAFENGDTISEVFEMVHGWAQREIGYDGETALDREGAAVTSPFDQVRPQTSAIKYKVVGVYDADYRIEPSVGEDMVPHFMDHSSYFFIGKRQFGRNQDNANIAAVMQRGSDAFWSYQNINNSLINAAASWGACVFHSTESYTESSLWITQKDYVGTLAKGGKVTRDWYLAYDSNKKAWVSMKKFTPFRVLNGLQAYVEDQLKVKHNSAAGRVLGLPFALADLAVSPLQVAYVLAGAPLRNSLHRKGVKGHRIGWERFHDPKSPASVDMLSSQDFTTESEDVASCKRENRQIETISGHGDIPDVARTLGATINPLEAYRRLRYYFTSDNPLERSGWRRGIGGGGSNPDDARAFKTTKGSRWSRGNLAVAPDIAETKMSFWGKRGYNLLVKYWLLSLLRVSFVASPVLFAALGADPIITEDLNMLTKMALTNFGLNMGTYLYSQYTRGYRAMAGLSVMLEDYYYLNLRMRSVIDGYFMQEKTGFVASPKKTIVPIRNPLLRDFKFEAVAGLMNLATAAYSIYFSIATHNPQNLAVGGWALFNTILLWGSIAHLNKGVLETSKKPNWTNPLLNSTGREYPPTAPYSEEGKN